jgi:putative exosortase-associated protein (TIGR04073 family)
MRFASRLTLVGLTTLLAAGCAGPENKLGRGLLNLGEPLRMGELRRSMEQQSLWDNRDTVYVTGFIKGFNRTVVRTVLGAFEVATFPIPTPTYKPLLVSKKNIYPDMNYRNIRSPWGGMRFTEHPTYPDSYWPGLMEDSTFDTDTALGYSGGDAFPFIPGSRFRIFDN